MREIKFRAWAFNHAHGCHIMSEVHNECARYITDNAAYPDRVIMQFTGLKDQNRVDIYEGDIIEINCYLGKPGQFEDRVCKVVFKDAKFQAEHLDAGRRFDVHGASEVIGNIYQNPELLTPKSA